MEKRQKTIALAVIIATLVISIGVTVAYFVAPISRTNQTVSVTTGTLKLTFDDISESISKTMHFGDTVTSKLKITNTGTLDVKAQISWKNLVNTYMSKSLVYTLSYGDSDTQEADYEEIITSEDVPVSNVSKNFELGSPMVIPAGETYNYVLTITLIDSPDVNQTSDLNASFYTEFTIEEKRGTSAKVPDPIYCVVDANDIIDNTYSDSTYTYTRASSDNGYNWSVKLRENYEGTDVSAAPCTYINSEPITSMMNMFAANSNLTSIDLSNFNTSNVTDMSGMFAGCTNLMNLDLSSFDTRNVTSMHGMFLYDIGLTNLDLSSFDTSNVTTLNRMFFSCRNLTGLNLSSFDTSNVAVMSQMFVDCSSITELDLSSFDTGNVTTMFRMFWGATNLRKIYVSDKFTTTKISNSGGMFFQCTSLVGGNGTLYDGNMIDSTYAKIDGAGGLPGYFTDIKDKP